MYTMLNVIFPTNELKNMCSSDQQLTGNPLTKNFRGWALSMRSLKSVEK